MRWSKNKLMVVAAGAAIAGVSIVGCSSESLDTANASEVASAAASAVKSETGQEAIVDCGSSTLKLEVGESVDCSAALSDGIDRSATVSVVSVAGDSYTVDVTLSPSFSSDISAVSIDELQIVVANTLNEQTKAQPSVACEQGLRHQVGATSECQAKFPGEDEPRVAEAVVKSLDALGSPQIEVKLTPSGEDKAFSDSYDSVEEVVADALEPQVGGRPIVDCGEGFVQIIDGQELTCSVSTISGESLGEASIEVRDAVGASYAVDVALQQIDLIS
ncbi:hypothetical protein [Rothia nasimurium]|uniref:hypothetical protein n=1 Tax=Rothia nasimurium TaxID=85336 RepID=UPI001F2AC36A|nr:hypothetical protein [Rothia nasimurium]